MTSPISSEAWVQFIYCSGLDCVFWKGVPHFNHSGREEVVSVASCSLCLEFFAVPSCCTTGFFNISFDGHCGHLRSWWIESILLINLNVWIMSVLYLLKFRLESCNSISLLLYGSPFVSGTSHVARHWTCSMRSLIMLWYMLAFGNHWYNYSK